MTVPSAAERTPLQHCVGVGVLEIGLDGVGVLEGVADIVGIVLEQSVPVYIDVTALVVAWHISAVVSQEKRQETKF